MGSKSCQDCHDEEYERFQKYSKKAHSWESIELMRSNLKPAELRGCYECHTTGYGQPGGFESIETTPHMADVGCETCHGPGFDHVDSGGDPELIQLTPTPEQCETCHSEERIGDFDFKPLIHSGAH